MKKIYRGMQNAAEDIQANFDELGNLISKDNTQIIFDGVVLWNETQSYAYDLDKLKVGIQLVFGRYDKAKWKELDYGYNTVTISKSVLKQYNGQLFYAAMPDLANVGVVKQFKFSRTHITGTAANTDVGSYALKKNHRILGGIT